MTSGDSTPPTAPRRDRDRFGRPRNNRPRDGLGRPLPREAHGVHPTEESLPAGGEVRTADETIQVAQRLLDAGMPFHAHEVFEDAWNAAPPDQRTLWRGLTQLAVGITHEKRGNARGADALLRRGAETLLGYAASAPYELNITALVEWSYAAAQAARDGATLPPTPRLRRRS